MNGFMVVVVNGAAAGAAAAPPSERLGTTPSKSKLRRSGTEGRASSGPEKRSAAKSSSPAFPGKAPGRGKKSSKKSVMGLH